MPSAWIRKRKTKSGETRHRVEYRVGGRESRPQYGGSFRTKREALTRKAWIAGELAAMRVPKIDRLARTPAAPTFGTTCEQWHASRVDVRQATAVQHRVALARVRPMLGHLAVDRITPADCASVVAALHSKGHKRDTIRKSLTAVAMVLDFAGISPNPARDRVQVRLPLEEPDEVEPPSADHVEAAGWLLKPDYLFGLLVLDATGARVHEFEAATIADLDENRRAWRVRAAVAKTRRARLVELPEDLFDVLLERLPAREDRDSSASLFGGVSGDRLRTAIARACRDAGIPRFSPHDLRHRRISLLHRQGVSWAEIGERMGQRSKAITADTYSHVLIDPREIDRQTLLMRIRAARMVPPLAPPSAAKMPS
jgi:site-specific recombinase XerD